MEAQKLTSTHNLGQFETELNVFFLPKVEVCDEITERTVCMV